MLFISVSLSITFLILAQVTLSQPSQTKQLSTFWNVLFYYLCWRIIYQQTSLLQKHINRHHVTDIVVQIAIWYVVHTYYFLIHENDFWRFED